MKFSADREKENLIQGTRALLPPVYSVILPDRVSLSLLPLIFQFLTSGLHLALDALIKIGPVSEHATLLHDRFLHVLF